MYKLTVISTPAGRFAFVGRVPTDICTQVIATKAAVMGGRAFKGEDGKLYEWKAPSFDTESEALAHAANYGYTAAVPVPAKTIVDVAVDLALDAATRMATPQVNPVRESWFERLRSDPH